MNTFLGLGGKVVWVLLTSCCSFSEQKLLLQAPQLSRKTSFPQKLFTSPLTKQHWGCFCGRLLYRALRLGFQGQTAYDTLDLSQLTYSQFS